MNFIISYNHSFLGCDAVYLGQIPEDHALNIQYRTNIKYCNENLPLDLSTEFLGQSHTFAEFDELKGLEDKPGRSYFKT
jgi:hypothetical protein